MPVQIMRSPIIFRVVLVVYATFVARADDVSAMDVLRDVWGPNAGWPVDIQFACPSTWDGVTCIADKVQNITVPSKSLNGSIPTIIGELIGLTTLRLNNNQLTGHIPSELGTLPSLTDLRLHVNQLTGSIPTQLGQLTNLTYLHLGGNRMTGAIPPELGRLTHFNDLRLNENLLTGSIPTELGNLNRLQRLQLNRNNLTGTIPSELGNLATLDQLWLSGNLLEGSIPSELGNLTRLEYCYLDSNPFSCKFANLPPQCRETVSDLPDCTQLSSTSAASSSSTTSPTATTTTGTSSALPCPLPSPTDTAVCESDGTWRVPAISSNTTILVTAPTIVSGNATFASGSVVVFANGQATIIVGDTAFISLNSSFVLCLTKDQLPESGDSDELSVTLVSGSGGLVIVDSGASGVPHVLVSIDSNCFRPADVQVSPPQPVDCIVSPSATSSKFAVLISDCKSSSKSNTRTMAIVVGVVVSVFIIVAVIVGVMVWRIRTGRSQCGSRLVWSTERSRELM